MTLLRIINTKVLPLLLSTAMLINLQAPLYAQNNPYQKPFVAARDNTNVVIKKLDIAFAKALSVPKIPYTLTYNEVCQAIDKEAGNKNISQQDYNSIYLQYQADLKRQDAQVAHVTALLRKEYNPESLISYYQRKPAKNGLICEGKYCYPIEVWMHGILRVIIYQSTGQNTDIKKFKNNREIMLFAVPNISYIVNNYGLNRNDAYPLQKYLRFVAQGAGDYCDNDTYMADIAPGLAGGNGRADARQGKQRRQNECVNVGQALALLGMIGPFSQDRNQNAKVIYDAVKDTYDDDYGAVTLSMGVGALIATDTKNAYDYIDALLTKDTLPTGSTFKAAKNIGGQILDLLSISSWSNKGIEAVNLSRGGGGRYLNDYNQKLQYIDEDYSRASGMSNFSISVAKSSPSLGYNVSYRNVLEDIGIMLGQAQNPAAKKLINKIINKYTTLEAQRPHCMLSSGLNPVAFENCSPGKNVHLPLVTGLLQTSRAANSQAAAKIINTLDWWDLNEGTQRRINNTVTGKYSGTVKRTLNQAKKKRNDANTKIAQASFWADVLVSAIFVTALVKSLPSIGRSLSNAARTLRVTVSGKGNLLKITRARIAVGGINPQIVKLSLAAKYKQARSLPKTFAAPKTVAAPTQTAKSTNAFKLKLTSNSGAEKEIIATYTKEGSVKIAEPSINPAARKMEGTLQQDKTIIDQKTFVNNLTAQVGEGGGASASGTYSANVSATFKPAVIDKPIIAKPAPTPAAQTFTAVKKPVTAPAGSKVISAERLKRAAFSGNIAHYKNIAGQFVRTLRTKTGAMAMAVNLSLANPVMLNAASSGKLMPMIESISSYERAASATSTVLRSAKAMPIAETAKIMASDVKLANNIVNGAKIEQILKPNILTPVLAQTLRPIYGATTGLKYITKNSLRFVPRYMLGSYLWFTTVTVSPNATPVKPQDQNNKQVKNEFAEDTPLHKADIGYQALTTYAEQCVSTAVGYGETISNKTIEKLQNEFGDSFSQEELSELSSQDNIDKLFMISPIASKSLFDRMLSLIATPDSEKDAVAILKSNNKKALTKLIAKKSQNNKIFNNFFDAIMISRESHPNSFFTLNNEIPLPKEGFRKDAVVAQDDILPTMIKNFFKTKSMKDVLLAKTEKMSMQDKNAIMARMLSVGQMMSDLEAKGYPKGAIKPVLMGNKYQWEQVNSVEPKTIVVSVETDKGDMSLQIAKWAQKRGVPSPEADYLKLMPAWIADELGLSTAKPGKFVADGQSFNYFIYNAEGTERVRFGPHEKNPANIHIHIERVNTNGEWDGIINEAYPIGLDANIKEPAARARSLFEQASTKSESLMNHQADEIGKTFKPIADFLGSTEAHDAAAAIAKASDKQDAVKQLFNILDELIIKRYFFNNLDELKAQGLVK